jgi:hypothetical protein
MATDYAVAKSKKPRFRGVVLIWLCELDRLSRGIKTGFILDILRGT